MKQISDHSSLHEWYTSKQAEKHPLREETSYERRQRAHGRSHKPSPKNNASYEKKAMSKYEGGK
jgi:hypothetical protein